MKAKPLTPREYKAIYSKVPRLTVEVIVKTHEGVVLTVYYKETLEEAVGKEELSRHLKSLLKIPFLSKKNFFCLPINSLVFFRQKLSDKF